MLILSCFHHSTCDIYIPKLSINMETYPHLVSSQIQHIYYFIIYLYSKTIIVLCNILNSQNIAGNIFVNEQCIELNPGPVFLYLTLVEYYIFMLLSNLICMVAVTR